jgi:hypothetical protein
VRRLASAVAFADNDRTDSPTDVSSAAAGAVLRVESHATYGPVDLIPRFGL